MATSYFIRLRGNVQGPFDAERLRQLARRGQFTRLHEVSTDGQEWRPAGELSELFSVAAGPSLPSSAAGGGAGNAVSSPVARTSAELPPGTAQEAWYYEWAGQPQGPVDLATLQKLLEQGQLTHRSRVWRAGMADWTPAGNVPQLAAIVTQPAFLQPHVQPPVTIKHRNIGVVALLSIITLGIYNLYLLMEWSEELNNLLGRKKYSPAIVLLTSLLTCCLLGTVFECLYAFDIEAQSRIRNIRGRIDQLALLVLICNIGSLLISIFVPGAGLFVAIILATLATILIQSELNKFAGS